MRREWLAQLGTRLFFVGGHYISYADWGLDAKKTIHIQRSLISLGWGEVVGFKSNSTLQFRF
jgi:hypothetical protein